MRAQKGFTLIEILVAIAIMALISALAIPGFDYAFRINTEGFARQMASLFRESRDRAILRKLIVRLRIDLKEQQFWVEEANNSYLIPSDAEAKAAEDKRDDRDEKEKAEENPFRISKELTPNKRKIPHGVKVIKVISPRSQEPITEGDAYVYYMPNGMADPAIIHIEDMEKTQQSLVVNPVTGVTKLEQGFFEGDKK